MVGRSKLLPALTVVFFFCEHETRLSRCFRLLFRRCDTFFYDLDTRHHVPVSPTSRTWCDHDPFLRSGLPAASVEFLFEYIFHIFSYYNECWLVTSITAFCNQVRRRFTTLEQDEHFFIFRRTDWCFFRAFSDRIQAKSCSAFQIQAAIPEKQTKIIIFEHTLLVLDSAFYMIM